MVYVNTASETGYIGGGEPVKVPLESDFKRHN